MPIENWKKIEEKKWKGRWVRLFFMVPRESLTIL
jgi:hypothetical protein